MNRFYPDFCFQISFFGIKFKTLLKFSEKSDLLMNLMVKEIFWAGAYGNVRIILMV